MPQRGPHRGVGILAGGIAPGPTTPQNPPRAPTGARGMVPAVHVQAQSRWTHVSSRPRWGGRAMRLIGDPRAMPSAGILAGRWPAQQLVLAFAGLAEHLN